MRKLVLAMFTSLDGFINGPDGELIMPHFSPDLASKWIGYNLGRFDLMVYGRVCYEGMVGFWTSPAAPPEEAARLAAMEKIVLSTTLERADWGRARIVRDDVAGEFARLKQTPGRDMAVIGGGRVASSLLQLGLIDEMRLLVMPMLFGGGTRLFEGGYPRTGLALEATEPLDNGSVLLNYRRG
jgi:dihydrofolate reductase